MLVTLHQDNNGFRSKFIIVIIFFLIFRFVAFCQIDSFRISIQSEIKLFPYDIFKRHCHI